MSNSFAEPEELFIDNDGIRIHCIDSGNMLTEKTMPLVVIPGMVNAAEEYIPDFRKYIKTRRCIFISIRGRGKSEAPTGGYTFDEQVSDIRSVIETLKLTSFHLFGHSVGGAFALGYALRYPVSGKIIIGDYPPVYPAFSEQWADRVRMRLPGKMSDTALDGIVRDARTVDMFPSLAEKTGQVYLIFGSAEDSLITLNHLDMYKAALGPDALFRLEGQGHALFSSDNDDDACITTIEHILHL
jgi:pimeloyl-ACP methyl ester carboxylesterase